MLRLKGVAFETAIIERYRRRERSVEEALMEMYLAGVSVRRVEDITEVLWGTKVSPATISELNKKAYVHIEDWRNRPLQGGQYPYVYVDGIYLRRNWGGEYENVAVLVAIAVNEDGYREVLGATEGMKGDKRNRGRFSVMTEKQRMTNNEPGDEYGENSKSSGRQRDLPCDAAGITGKGYSKTTRNAYGEPSPVHTGTPCGICSVRRTEQIPKNNPVLFQYAGGTGTRRSPPAGIPCRRALRQTGIRRAFMRRSAPKPPG